MEANEIVRIVTSRHTCKAFDPARRISEADFAALRVVLRYAPSSVNSQPWHYLIAETATAKARVAEAMHGSFAYNAPKVLNASHSVVMCARTDLDEAHLAAIITQEDENGRFPTPEAKATQSATRNHYANLHRNEMQDMAFWTQKQLYIALGNLLQAAGALGIDACPMEGFDKPKLDEVLGLAARGLTSVLVVSLGYRSDADFNAKLPKSRLDESSIFSMI